MYRLVYVSSATSAMSESDLHALLKQSKRNNKRRKISGLLLYADGNFIQVIEGQEKNLDRLYHKIKCDPRNTGHILINKQRIEHRAFEEWGMSFKVISPQTIENLDGYSRFLQNDSHLTPLNHQSRAIANMLYQFKESCA